MARRTQEIKTVSYVRVGDELVRVRDLNEEQKERLAIGLKTTYLNELFKGQAEFSPPPGFEVKSVDGKISVTRVPSATEPM